MKDLKTYINESGFSKKNLETEAASKVLSWAKENDWDYDKVNQVADEWFDGNKSSWYFDHRKFNNKEAGIFTDYIHTLLSDKNEFENFKKKYNK